MDLLNIKDTVIYKDDKVLGGVFYFSMKSAYSNQVSQGGDGLYEILSAKPWEIVGTTESYVITLKQYATDYSDLGTDSFVLKFEGANSSKTFYGCKVMSTETYVDEGKVVTVSVINAEGMC